MRRFVNPATFGRQSLGLARVGCTNRPFYQIVVLPDKRLGRRYENSIIEQVGSFDPIPNGRNEKLISFNIDRIKYWIAKDAFISLTLMELLGLAGIYPLHPKTFVRARHMRANAEKASASAASTDVQLDGALSNQEHVVSTDTDASQKQVLEAENDDEEQISRGAAN